MAYNRASAYTRARQASASYKRGETVSTSKYASTSSFLSSRSIVNKAYTEKQDEILKASTTTPISKPVEPTIDVMVKTGEHVYQQKTAPTKTIPVMIPQPIMRVSEGFQAKAYKERNELANMPGKPLQKRYYGTSSVKYGQVGDTGIQEKSPVQIRNEVTALMPRTSPISGYPKTTNKPPNASSIPKSFWGTTSRAYGEVTTSGEQNKIVSYRPVPAKVGSVGIEYFNVKPNDKLPPGSFMQLESPPKKITEKIGNMWGAVNEVGSKPYGWLIDKGIRYEERNLKNITDKTNTLSKKRAELFNAKSNNELSKLWKATKLTSYDTALNFLKVGQVTTGFNIGALKYTKKPATILATAYGGTIIGGLGGGFFASTSGKLISGALLAGYAGSTGYQLATSRTWGGRGEILGRETVSIGALSAGIGIGRANKIGIDYAPKKKIKYAKYQDIEYAPKTKIKYAPKIKGEITYNPYRPLPIRDRFKSDYEQFGESSFRVTRQRKQPSEWANYKEPLNAFTGNYKTSRWTKPQPLDKETIGRINLPNKYKGQAYLEYPEMYYNVDTDWAIVNKPQISSAKSSSTDILGNMAKPPGNVNTGASGSTSIFKPYLGESARSHSRQEFDYIYHIRTLAESRDFLTEMGRAKNTDAMYKYFYKEPFKTFSPIYASNIDYFNFGVGSAKYSGVPASNALGIGYANVGSNRISIGNAGLINKQETGLGIMSGIKYGLAQRQVQDTENQFKFKLAVANKSEQFIIPKPELIPKLEQTTIQKVIPIQEVILDTAQKTRTRQVTVPEQTTDEILRPPIVPDLKPPIRPPKDIIEPKPPKPEETPFPFFSYGRRGSKGFTSKKSKTVKFKTYYTPSLTAITFNIRGTKPSKASIASGLFVRPIIK